MNVDLQLLEGEALYQRVVLEAMVGAQESLWIATANVKDCQVQLGRRYESIVRLFGELCDRDVEVRLLHAGVPSAAFRESLAEAGLAAHPQFHMRRCPRVHFKAVLVDDRQLYLESANLTGAGMGAKSARRRNFELGILTADRSLSDRVAQLFHRIWEGLECPECGRQDVCYVPLEEPDA